jgi:hypothetical protein
MVAVLIVLVVMLGLWVRDALTGGHDGRHEAFSVTIRNQCHHPVWIFFGPDGPLRPEDASSLGGRAAVSELMMHGDVLWLLDDDRQRLDSATVSFDTTSIDVLPSCRELRVDRR